MVVTVTDLNPKDFPQFRCSVCHTWHLLNASCHMLHTPLRSFLLQTRDLSYFPPPQPHPQAVYLHPRPRPSSVSLQGLFVKASASNLVFSFSHIIVVPCLQLWPVPRPSQGLFFLISSSWEGHSHFSPDPARLHVDPIAVIAALPGRSVLGK